MCVMLFAALYEQYMKAKAAKDTALQKTAKPATLPAIKQEPGTELVARNGKPLTVGTKVYILDAAGNTAAAGVVKLVQAGRMLMPAHASTKV